MPKNKTSRSNSFTPPITERMLLLVMAILLLLSVGALIMKDHRHHTKLSVPLTIEQPAKN